MIQRIQSFFLVIVILLHVAMFFTTIWEGVLAAQTAEVDLFGITYSERAAQNTPVNSQYTLWMVALNTTIVVLSFGGVFLFRRRRLQVQMVRLLILMECVLLALMFFTIEEAKEFVVETSNIPWRLGIFIPALAIILLFLASRYIIRDERLVRSADRLR